MGNPFGKTVSAEPAEDPSNPFGQSEAAGSQNPFGRAPAENEQQLTESGLPQLPKLQERSESKPRGIIENVTAGFSSGIDQTQALGGGIAMLAGDYFGSKALKDYGMDVYNSNMAEAEKNSPRVNRIEDINNIGDFSDWFAGVTGQLAPTMLTIVATGGVGGAIAQAGAKKLISKSVAKQIKDGVENEATKAALKKIAKAKVAGQLGGAFVGSTGIETGSIYGETLTDKRYDNSPEMQDRAMKAAAIGGLSAGALEMIPVVRLGKRLGFAGGLSEKIAKNLSEMKMPGRVLSEGIKQSGIEGLTELMQTVIEKSAQEYAIEQNLDEVLSPENMSEYWNAAAAGAAGGLVFGGVAGIPKPKQTEGLPVDSSSIPQGKLPDPETAPLDAVDVLGDVSEVPDINQADKSEVDEMVNTSIPGAASVENAATDGSQDATGAIPGVNASETAQETTAEPEVNYFDNRLKRDVYRARLEGMTEEIVYNGGKALVPDPNYKTGESDVRDENGRPQAPLVRTPSLNPEWFQSLMADKDYNMPVEQVQNAVKKANKGEHLGVRQARVVEAMLNNVADERTSGANMEYAREQLRMAREARAAAKMPDAEDWLFEEQSYQADDDGLTRLLLEFSEQAKSMDADTRNSVEDLLYSDLSDEEIVSGVQQLFGEYYGRKSEESAQAYQEQKLESGLPGTGREPGQPGEPAAGAGQPEGIDAGNRPVEQPGLSAETGLEGAPAPVSIELEETPTPLIRRGSVTDRPPTGDRRQKKTPGLKDDKRKEERRRSDLYRKSIDSMSMGERKDVIEQLRHDATVNKLTGVKDRAAWEEDALPEAEANGDYIVSIDADSLGWVNDNIGNKAGDKLLVEVANALKAELGDNVYHVSGDEFWAHGADKKELENSLKSAQKSLKTASIESEGSTVTGLAFSYGITKDATGADRAMKADKKAREEAGERVAKTSRPDGVHLKGEDDSQSGAKQNLAAAKQETGKSEQEIESEFDDIYSQIPNWYTWKEIAAMQLDAPKERNQEANNWWDDKLYEGVKRGLKKGKKSPGKTSDLAGQVDDVAQSKKDAEIKAKQEQTKKEDAAAQHAGEPDLLSGGELESDLFAPEKKHPGKKATDAKQIDDAAHEAATSPKNGLKEPSEAQKDAENYKTGDIPNELINGLDVKIENPKGSYRFKIDIDQLKELAKKYKGVVSALADLSDSSKIPAAFKKLEALSKSIPALKSILEKGWYNQMKSHYGKFTGTRGADGDPVDVFLGEKAHDETLPVFIIDQVNKDGTYDESKVMVGYADEAAARKGYLENYDKGWTGLGAISELSQDELKTWLSDGDTKSQYAKSLQSKAETVTKTTPKAQKLPDTAITGTQDVVVKPEAAKPATDEKTANAILNAAKVAGTDRLDVMAKFRDGTYSLGDLRAAYPAKETQTKEPKKVDSGQVSGEKPEVKQKNSDYIVRQPGEAYTGKREQQDTTVQAEKPAKDGADRVSSTIPGKIKALGITSEEIKTKGSTELIGKTITSPESLADLAQVFRNPKYETLRYFFTKNGEIVHATGVSSRLPGRSGAFPVKNGEKWLKGQIKKAGADGYWLVHNHPSGDPKPSRADVGFTTGISDEVPGFLGHVIINSNKYATIDSAGSEQIIEKNFGEDKLLKPSVPNAFLYESISDAESLANIAKNLQRKEGYLTLIGASGSSGVRVISEISVESIRSPASAQKLIKQFSLNSGSTDVFLYGYRNDINEEIISGLIKEGYIVDAVMPDVSEKSGIYSFRQRVSLTGRNKFMSEEGGSKGEFIESEKKDYKSSVLTTNEVKTAVADLKNDIGAPINVLDNERQLPDEILAQAELEGATGDIAAVHWRGEIYIVADQMRDRLDVENATLHEGQHFIGDNYFGRGKADAYQRLWFKIGGKKGMRTLAKKLGFSMDSYFETADRLLQEKKITSRDRAVYLVDEFLAHAKGQQVYDSLPARIKRAIKEFIGKIRDLLRKSGFVELPKATEADIQYLLKTINDSVRDNPKAGKFNVPAFMTVSASEKQETIDNMRGDDKPQFSRSKKTDDTQPQKTPDRKYTKEQQEAIDKGGFGALKEAHQNPLKAALGKAKNSLDESKQVWKTMLRQGFLDQYDSFRTIVNNKRAWMMANLSQASGGVIEAALEYGRPFMNKGAVDVDVSKKSLSEILEPLGNEVNDFLMWVAGNRAERLSSEDRERLFSDVDIQALKSLNRGKMEDGRIRSEAYESVRKEFEELNDAMVQIGVKTGVISPDEANIWRKQGFYVPFYRIADEEAKHGIRGPYTGGGLVKQTAYKRLKGADIPLGDLLTNVVMNWNHIVSSGLKNQAAVEALAAAKTMGLATKVTEAEKSKDAVFVRLDGKKIWLELDESKEGQLVLESLMSLNYNGLNNFVMKAARKFKRILTYGVTASPEFKAANLFRDTIQAIAVADMSTNIAKNLVHGFRATKKDSPTIARMIAGGGAFGDSGYIHGSDPEALERLVRKDIDRMTILDSPKRIQKMWDAYQDFGARLENVNRAANFEQDLSRGDVDLLTANFNARDHLDFQRTGAFVSIRILAQTVPFLNARLQGLSKLGRSGFDKNQQKQFAVVVGTYALASVMLYLYMKDDDDYDEAPQWERDAYHLFKIPGSDVMYRLPRPFEVGFMATIAERAAEQMVNDKVHGSLFFERLWHGLLETLSFNPMPQMVMPAVEVWANKNTFTGRQIESQSMKNLSPSERKRSWTSETAIAMSKGFDAVLWDDVTLSPLQIEHLVNGYFGWMGGVTLESIDMIIRGTSMAPSTPERRIQDYMLAGRFARTGPTRGTRYTTEFYKNLYDANRVYADIRFAIDLGNKEKAMALAEKNKNVLAMRDIYVRAQKSISRIGKQAMVIRMKNMPDDQKREEIERLTRMKNEITKKVVEKSSLFGLH